MRRRDERGDVVVVVALFLVAALVVVAIVVDLGQLRSDRHANKRLTDSAVTAAAQDLQVGPWAAVCTGYHYVLADAAGFSSFDTETWTNVAAVPLPYPSTPGNCPTGTPTSTCVNSDPSTWAHFRGTAQSGDVTVDIENGYSLPDPSFSEDTTIAGDNGSPCDQVAIIVSQRRAMAFGGIAGVRSRTTTVRSVARIARGPGQTAALVVLDHTTCRAIDASTNGGKLVVHSSGETPGSIDVDSDGSACSGGQTVVQGSPLPSVGGPNVIAQPTISGRSGRIGIYALSTNPGVAYSQACPYTLQTVTCTITPVPVPSPRLGRTFLDQRYQNGVLATVATAIATINSVTAAPTGYTRASTYPGVSYNSGNNNCTVSGPVTIPDNKVFIDCDLIVASGGTLDLSGSGVAIVAGSTITVNGTSSTNNVPGSFIADNPSAVYVYGLTRGSSPVALNIGGNFSLNGGTASAGTCPTPAPGNPTAALVVENGQLSVGGGSSALRMCQTALIMANGYATTGVPPNAWPTSPGYDPFDNHFTGNLSISGQGAVVWTAPNAVPDGPASQADWDHLEDLALWTETSAGSSIAGQGGLTLAGVFALPNCNPFTISGTGSQTISADAQFWTRQLTLSGQALLEMAPNPNDSIPTLDFLLVR